MLQSHRHPLFVLWKAADTQMWNQTSVPQINVGPKYAVMGIAIGRVVGGGSAVNGMYNMRGSADDYNRWEQLFGTQAQNNTANWGWEGILPYFQKGLNFIPPPPELTSQFDSLKYDASYWGNTSEIYAGWPKFYWPGVTTLLDAFKEIEGVEFPPDSGAGQPGVYWQPSLMDPRSATRSYAQTGHYRNVITTRPNYHLLISTLARRVLFDDELTATGVEFLANRSNDSTVMSINASKEVILSAGTIYSPQLLQLSVIGPRKLLGAGGIEVLLDLPGVGQNFHDHSSLFAINMTRPYSIASPNVAAWLPLTAMSDQADALATKLEQQDFASILPTDTHPTVLAGYEAQMKALAGQMRSENTAFARLNFLAASGLEGPVLLQATNRGSVNINTTDPRHTEPLVDYRALSNPVESDIYIESIKFYRRYHFNTTLASKYTPIEYGPGTNVTSDEDYRSFISNNLLANDLHPVGTCSMLPLELGGVVDQTLRVCRNVKGLRVVDGSIIPMVPSANTCQPIYAIAEKTLQAADLIKSGV
ncbi:hypothetical protein N0V82_001996 [Gnomoniopsis sp. IMI 355080]|nr:hypothetical protein N0V82_001996 [Gnomoniopsis sp. IMI 355080]